MLWLAIVNYTGVRKKPLGALVGHLIRDKMYISSGTCLFLPQVAGHAGLKIKGN